MDEVVLDAPVDGEVVTDTELVMRLSFALHQTCSGMPIDICVTALCGLIATSIVQNWEATGRPAGMLEKCKAMAAVNIAACIERAARGDGAYGEMEVCGHG